MTPLEAAKLAQAAYSTKPTVGPEDGSARFIFSADGSICSIPGTNNEECIKTDIEFLPHEYPGLGSVHRGFIDALAERLSDLSECSPEIIIGHSEGASLAGLYAACLCLKGKPPKSVFGFEPAKTSTDDVLASLLSSHGVQLYLTCNGNDIVPHMPFQVLFMNWQHYGPITKIGEPSLPFLNVEDHEMSQVISSLEKLS